MTFSAGNAEGSIGRRLAMAAHLAERDGYFADKRSQGQFPDGDSA
ncbi:MAG: hypothetical protein O3B13_12070 [Planctomycetota bacterium]|nr:hypothetical protein [Planctomycetota bacterium]